VSIFGDRAVVGDLERTDPAAPVALTPQAASDGLPGDGGGLDLSFFVSLGATLGTLADTLQADRDRRDSMIPPSNEQLLQSGFVDAGGDDLLLDLGSVPLGRVWQVRRLIVGRDAVTTAATGSAYVFAHGAPPRDLNLTNCVDIFTTLPQGNTYGTHQLFLLPSEHLWVVFHGATATAQYTAAARVEDWDDATFRSTFAE
jgi:hypothetical protein